MPIVHDLNPTQIRILGALLEKEQATPAYYPLTVNSLIAACNQKSNRDPVTELTEGQILDELDNLRTAVLVWRSEGARTERWSQSISRRLELDPEEKAILTLLMLRGPQTIGELRSRGGRLHAFESLYQVEEALRRMADEERELVVELPRRPGQKESRWAQLLGGEPEDLPATSVETAPAIRATDGGLAERVTRLEERVEELTAMVDRLRQTPES
jgi:uncharacterized protein YceH (UPF0502 family)